MRAWLITKQDFSGGKLRPEEVVSIISPRRGEKFVKQYMEQLFLDTAYKYYSDRLAQIKSNSDFNQAQNRDHIGYYTCGDTPMLEARKVTNIWVETDHDGNEILKWSDPKRKTIAERKRELGLIP